MAALRDVRADPTFAERFDAASATRGSVERWYRIAGRGVRLRFAGAALVGDMTRALAHLAVDPMGDADLTVSVWDSDSTDVPPPPLPATDPTAPEGAWYFEDRPPRRTAYRPNVGVCAAFDADARTGWYWLADA